MRYDEYSQRNWERERERVGKGVSYKLAASSKWANDGATKLFNNLSYFALWDTKSGIKIRRQRKWNYLNQWGRGKGNNNNNIL